MADVLMLMTSGVHGGEAEPSAFGLLPYQWVSLSLLVLLAILLWKRVPSMIAKGLDAKIEAIRLQLEEARRLREEAEALRNEYAAKIANAEKDAQAMLENARREAELISEQAEAQCKAMIERRQRMAEDKIAAAEREAVQELRSKVVATATAASRKLLAERLDQRADAKISQKVIDSI